MTKTNMKIQTFLVKTTTAKQAVMRLPVGKYGVLTRKAFDMISTRFYDGVADTRGQLQYAVNLEAYSNADDIISALQDLKEYKTL
jgi:hypothetical protein